MFWLLLGTMTLSGFAGKSLWNSGFVSSMFFIPGVLAVILSVVGLAFVAIAAFAGTRDIALSWYFTGLLAAGLVYCEIGLCLGLMAAR